MPTAAWSPPSTTAANEAGVEQVAGLLHGKEEHVWADSGYGGARSRVQDAKDSVKAQIGAQIQLTTT